MATLVLRLTKGSPLTNAEVDNNFSSLNVEVTNVEGNVGVLANLSTTAKSNLVSAINEIAAESTSSVAITGGTIANISGSNVTITSGNISGVTLTGVTLISPSGINTSSIIGLTTANVSELTNLYFTNARALANISEAGFYNTVANTAPIGASESGTTLTLTHLDSGVVAATYGNATLVPVITVNSSGHVTSVSNVAVAGGGGGGGSISITNETANTSSAYYPLLGTVTTGTLATANVSSTKLYFNPSTGTLNATVFNSLSDQTQKLNVSIINNASETIQNINGVEFTWSESGRKSSGVIAQELENVLPHLVDTGPEGLKSVNYSGIIAYLIEAVKELQNRVNALESK